MRRIWNIKKSDAGIEAGLIRDLNISPIIARILVNRNIVNTDDVKAFLYGDMRSCYDPFLMKDMNTAVTRILDAIQKKERMLIYGDYDVDGITSVALLKRVFDEMGAVSLTYIPNRLEEGYGLNEKAIDFASQQRIGVIITVDCGIDAVEEVRKAASLGIDVIVTDHHEVKKENIPEALAIINPHQPDCQYPFKQLAGVGVVYKLAQALTKKRFCHLERHLDLVAMGTVADIVPQRSENRIFTKAGLEVLNSTDKVGLKSLIAASGLDNRAISASHIGFMLGPRINAMGRIGAPDIALELLLTDNRIKADKMASILNRENNRRQKIEAGILVEALELVEREVNFKEQRIIVLAREGWHQGVIGIVASRIQERYYRPTIMIALENEKGKGSGRSIKGFNLFEAVKSAKDMLIDFGGHERACGLSIKKDSVGMFREAVNNYAMRTIQDNDLFPRVDIDVDLPLTRINKVLINELELLRPFGPENPKPVFVSSDIVLRDEPRYLKKNGVKMWVRNDGVACEAISFRRNHLDIPRVGQTFDIAYSPSINNWQGLDSIQLDLKDIRIKQ